MSDGTFRKRKYLTPPTRPDRSSSQSRGMLTISRTLSIRRLRRRLGGGTTAITRRPPLLEVLSLDRVEEGLEAVDVLARALEPVGLDHGVRALTVDLPDAVRLEQRQVAVDDPVLVAVERPNRRPGDPVAFGVVRASVAGTAEVRRLDRGQRQLRLLRLDRLALVVLPRAARLRRTPEMDTAVGDDRDARPAVLLPVVADEGRPARHLSGGRVEEERRLPPFALGVLVERAEIDALELLPREGRQHGESEDGHRDDARDHTAEPERRQLEELVARKALDERLLARGHGRDGLRLGKGGRTIGGHHVAGPEERKDGCDDHAGDDDRQADDEPYEDARDADGEPDRPNARRGQMRLVVSAVRLQLRPSSALVRGESTRRIRPAGERLRQRRNKRCKAPRRPSCSAARASSPYSLQRASTRAFTSGVNSISGGHSRVPSSRPFAVASMPILPPTNCRVGAWSRWSSGPSVSRTSRLGSTLAPT